MKLKSNSIEDAIKFLQMIELEEEDIIVSIRISTKPNSAKTEENAPEEKTVWTSQQRAIYQDANVF